MQRITTATRVVNKHGPGRDGFGDGNPTTGTPSTQLEANWFDQAQEEIARVIELAGMTLDPADLEQLHKAILFHVGAAGGGAFVLKAGDTMTGGLTISNGNLAVSVGSVTAAGTVSGNQLTSSGNINATATITGNQLTSTANINAVGAIEAAYINSTGSVDCLNLQAGAANVIGHLNGNTAGFSTSLFGAAFTASTIFSNAHVHATFECQAGNGSFQRQSGVGLIFAGNTATIVLDGGGGNVYSTQLGTGSGDFQCHFGNLRAFDFVPWSARELKYDIRDPSEDEVLAVWASMSPKRFVFRDRWPSTPEEFIPPAPRLVWGFIADDLHDDLVEHDEHGDPSGYGITQMLAATVAQMKAFEQQIQSLRAEVASLRTSPR